MLKVVLIILLKLQNLVTKVDANIGETMEEINDEWAKFMYSPLPADDPKNFAFFAHFMRILTTTCRSTVSITYTY